VSGNPYAVRRPGGVSFVIALTWIVAFLSIASGVMAILGADAPIAGSNLDSGASAGAGWAEVIVGALTALVAIWLAARSSLARLLVSALMIARIAGAIWIAFEFSGQGGWLASALIGGIAVLILLLLWNGPADAYFNR
jgi:hypothetical protein